MNHFHKSNNFIILQDVILILALSFSLNVYVTVSK